MLRSEPKRDEAQRAAGVRSGSGSGGHADEPTRVSLDRERGHAPLPGDISSTIIEGYELHSEIYRGGQGVVYLATQLSTRRRVALKVLLEGPFAGETARRRFEREIELAASLRHPNIVTILDSGVSEGRYYCVMEFIEGRRLDHYLREARPSLVDTLGLFERVCGAVNFAHQRGVIHRDLKPSNVLVDAEGVPRILDFGLAKAHRTASPDQTTVQVLSTTGQVLGTLAYMSPEQAAGVEDVDVRTDVYSLGVMLYEALLGQLPYPVDGPLGEVLNRIATDDPQRPRSLRRYSRFGRQIDDELETILLKSLEKDAARRYQTAGDLGGDLRRYSDGDPIEAKRASGLYILRKTLKRYRLQATAAALMLLMLVAFLLIFAGLYAKERDARARSTQMEALANQRANAALEAEAQAIELRDEAQRASAEARRSAEQLRRALIEQQIQRGDMSSLMDALAEARNDYWGAFVDAPDNPATLWALRRYYMDSGDDGARQLGLRPLRNSVVALSPDGELAAVQEPPSAIIVRAVDSGEIVAWWSAPRPPAAISVGADGAVVAAGAGWVRLWLPGSLEPVGVADLPRDLTPQAVVAVDDNRWVVVIGDEQTLCLDACDGRLLGSVDTPPLRGAPALLAQRRQAALPTADGVQLLTVDDDGRISRRRAWWRDGRTAQAVAFVADGRLLVASDGIDVAGPGDDGAWNWSLLLPLSEPCVDLQAPADLSCVAIASPRGRISMVHPANRADPWSTNSATWRAMRFSDDGRHLTVIDDSGAATRWLTTPRKQQRRQILNRPAFAWAVAPDGSAAVVAARDGRVVIVAPVTDADAPPAIVPRRIPLLARRGDVAPEDFAITVSDGGARVAFRAGNRVFLNDPGGDEYVAYSGADERLPFLKDFVLSGDGAVLALLAQTALGEEAAISFRRTDVRAAGQRPLARRLLPIMGDPFIVPGSPVRRMIFIAGSRSLLAARANGALTMFAPTAEARGALQRMSPAPRTAPDPWTVLESPAYELAADRCGDRLAAACDDGVVRILSIGDTSELGRVAVPGRVTALSFNASGDVLIIRTTDGTLDLYSLDPVARVARWPYSAAGAGLATWLGGGDSMLVEYDGAVYEHAYREIDRLIHGNRPFAIQRTILHDVSDGGFGPAWEHAAALRGVDDVLCRTSQEDVLQAALQRRAAVPVEAWCESLAADAPAPSLLRLASAAFESGRIGLAASLFEHGKTIANGQLDAGTRWRIAACDYLLGDYARAADHFSALLDRRDLGRRDAPTVAILHAVSLLFAGRRAEAQVALEHVQVSSESADVGDPAAGFTAILVANLILRSPAESGLIKNLNALLAVSESPLLNRDDVFFFAAELARHAGEQTQAAAWYQQCINVARDAWPADWAALRLQQLSGSTGEARRPG